MDKASPDSSSKTAEAGGSSPLAAPTALQQATAAPAVGNSSSKHDASSSSSSGSSKAPASPDAPLALQQAITAALDLLSDPLQALDEALQSLRQAAAWPCDLLAHAAVRNAATPEEQSYAEAQQSVVEKYVLHKPELFALEDDSGKEGGGDTAEEQQQDEAAAAAAAAGQLSDVAQLALQPPLALGAFVDPQVWWERQQELLALDRTCDHCCNVATLDQVGSCQYHIQLELGL
jgi:hypothetical protein